MATKKDLVEAYSFSRRRLVTAFVSGAPGGREVEPTRPGRTIIGGIALAVLLVAGALVLGILKSPTDVDWGQEGLFSDKGTGADYVNLAPADGGEPVLRPIINITSAMLLLGADVESTDVPEDEIAERTKGGTIGILQAPTTPPAVDKLIESGWTSCTSAVGGPDEGIRTRVTLDPGVTMTPGAGFVVRTPQDDHYVIAEAAGVDRPEPRAYAYPVPDRVDTVLQRVAGVSAADAVLVPQDWVALFPPGRPLDLQTFGLRAKEVKKGATSRLAGDGVVPSGAKVGTVLTDRVTDTEYLLLDDTALVLDAFAKAVYTGAFPEGAEIRSERISGTPSQVSAASSLDSTHWPTEPPSEQATGSLCAVLDAVPGQAPGVRLARADTGSPARADGTSTLDSDSTVEPGTGALVYAGDFDGTGVSSLYLIDDRGFAHRVRGEDERQRLGYGDVAAEVVPSSWVGLFEDGVLLSIDAARCPPTTTPQDDDGESCAGS